MAYFITRIELHDANWPDDYDALHSAMAARGFGRDIAGNDGKTYRLPRAEYVITGPYSIASVRDVAADAAKSTRKAAEVLVSETNNIMWQGLSVPQ